MKQRASGDPVFDRETDQAIIDAVISDKPALLQALSDHGLSREVVLGRAAEMGMTTEFIRQCRLSGSRAALRVCTNCDAVFLSAGSHNRRCRRCPRR